MKFHKIIYSVAAVTMLLVSCTKDTLDRPPLTSIVDDNYWRNEDDLRLFGNGFYTNYFNGYATGFTLDYTPVRGYTFNDDLTGKNAQSAFESSVPSSRGSNSEGAAWQPQYGGPTWSFAWVRKANIFLNRIENKAKPNLSADAYKHWTAVARFYRAYEYSRLVSVFGDVPYFDQELTTEDLPILYKNRDARGLVMDKVYDDLKYVMANMRDNDGTQYLNRYIAAGFISRFMLFEGTWEHYHGIDAARAKKYLEFSRDAAEYVMTSNKWNFTKDFKSIFTSESLAGHPEVLLYRAYDAALTITHSILSYQNGTEVVGVDGNLNLIRSFIVNDGKTFDNSAVPGAKTFTFADLAKTRDPRFEASFIDKPSSNSATLLYGYKFAPREAIAFVGKTYPSQYGSSTNTSDAPVLRLGEIVLNWIEAKAVLAQYYSGAAVTQTEIDKSINALRSRPLEAAAVAKGVQKTAPLLLSDMPVDPNRDADVPDLIWEIRRERRMEFVFEQFRLGDIRRWKKLNYMNFNKPEYLLGPWVNLPTELPTALTAAAATAKNVKVMKADANGNPNGVVVTYDGTNAASMVGFWMVTNASNRAAFTDKSYLSPVGQTQINQYKEKGFTLSQTTGW
ncbi:RagB/SusD family nutrient uptake outer membrane protein [Pedobacter boryungensis]|uniref:RagB/SusD family nutrient uptake outer membrane protein n=1 Tax=Pedobacter boryungensis TaxID=869962 RepID=A0ABX2DFL0_9SPHI|nr:RagB/SusD family nutrient uptake outer membrane protein [Pedobacter boryungensis]NQX32879.1 RagB/SusD family nutrient uptake outer membrane protein [Pedobacter boryungensis]